MTMLGPDPVLVNAAFHNQSGQQRSLYPARLSVTIP